jgi:HAD superfamily hydrolase (TIGR01509 family)
VKKAKLKTKCILLDLDGTVLDSKNAYLAAAQTALKSMGRKNIDVKTAMELPKRLEQDLPIDDLLAGLDVTMFLQTYLKAFYKATAEDTKPFPNVEDTLRRLSSKAKLALTTRRSLPAVDVLRILEKFGLARYFQKIVTSLDTENPKPDPEALVKCLKHLEIKACDCITVGDSVVDIRAGKNAGIRTVAVLSGIFGREELEREKPDLILKNISELPHFLE